MQHSTQRPSTTASRLGRVLALSLCFAGCRAPAQQDSSFSCAGTAQDPLSQISVADAALVDLRLWQAGLAVGHTQGDATLVVDDDAGVEHTFAARLDGTHVGLVADASADAAFGARYELLIPSSPALTVRGLLGGYEGTQVGLDVGVGGHFRHLKNSGNVELMMATVSFGVGVAPATWETLDLELWDDPLFDGSVGEGEGEGEGE